MTTAASFAAAKKKSGGMTMESRVIAGKCADTRSKIDRRSVILGALAAPFVVGRAQAAESLKAYSIWPENYARPMLEALAGQSPHKLAFLHARLKSDIRVKTGLTRFLPAILSGEFENSVVELVSWQGSGDIAATARANCYAVIPPDRENIAAGEWVAVMMR